MNPYDPCVCNKLIDGAQMTITWHVDDLKISHASDDVISSVIKWLESIYGTLDASRGPRHSYLGMDLDYATPGKVKVSMEQFTRKILDEFPKPLPKTAESPAAETLFNVRDKDDPRRRPLPEERAQQFHRTVAQLLFLVVRPRRDCRTAVAFLTTRVSDPDEDDWMKLRRVLRYLKRNPSLALTLEADNLGLIHWHVDASFAVHADMKSHTGGTMSLGKGSVIDTSHKQKLNTRSSTEAELVGADDIVTRMQWAQLFIDAQGYTYNTVLHQDNESAIRLELNGKRSSSKRTRHLNIRYFYITDQLDQGWLTVRHCPTEDMIGDFFTKPLQGQLFRRLRGLVMNCPADISPEYMCPRTAVPEDTGVCWGDRPTSNLEPQSADWDTERTDDGLTGTGEGRTDRRTVTPPPDHGLTPDRPRPPRPPTLLEVLKSGSRGRIGTRPLTEKLTAYGQLTGSFFTLGSLFR